MNREYIDRCPIHTLDEAILWLSSGDFEIEFYKGGVSVFQIETDNYITRDIGNGFDARGSLMMACRSLWMLLHGETQQAEQNITG